MNGQWTQDELPFGDTDEQLTDDSNDTDENTDEECADGSCGHITCDLALRMGRWEDNSDR